MKKDNINLNKGRKKKAITIISIVFVAIFIVGSKLYTDASTKEVALANPLLSNEKLTDTSYLNQLNEQERKIYDTIMDRISSFDDGVIDFGEPITETEMIRIITCVEIFNGDNEYAMLRYPMNVDNNVNYDIISNVPNSDTEKEKEAVIQKCILLLYPSEVKLEDIKVSEDGVIQNLNVFENNAVNTEKKEKALELEREGIRILDNVVKGLPEGAGQRDALEYFIGWIDKNLSYDFESYNKLFVSYSEEFETTENWYRSYYIPSSLSCVVEGNAMCLGYSKVLAYLCNSVGIKAKVISGSNISYSVVNHAITVVQIEDKTAYFDMTEAWDVYEGVGKALNKKTVENRLKMLNYFAID